MTSTTCDVRREARRRRTRGPNSDTPLRLQSVVSEPAEVGFRGGSPRPGLEHEDQAVLNGVDLVVATGTRIGEILACVGKTRTWCRRRPMPDDLRHPHYIKDKGRPRYRHILAQIQPGLFILAPNTVTQPHDQGL